MDVLDGADVDAPGRLADQQHIRVLLHFPGDHQLLLVAAGEVRGLVLRARRAHVPLLHLGLAILADRLLVLQPALVVLRAAVITEDEGLFRLEAIDQPHLVAVFRNVAEAEVAHPLRIGRMAQAHLVALGSGDGEAALAGLEDAAEQAEQLGLAVAGDPGDADHFPGAHREADGLDPLHPGVIDVREAIDLELGLARLGGALVDLEAHLAAHHQLGELLLVGVLGGDVGHHLPPAHDGDLIRDGQDLPQLVGDEDDGRALIPQLFQHLEQVIRLLRGQHPGGLVEDQDAGAAIERLEDLDPLLQAHRQILDFLVQRHLETIVPGQLAEQFLGRRQALAQVPAVFRAEDDVLQHGEVVHQHKVLVHHAHACGNRILGAMGFEGVAVDQHLASVGVVETVDDAHQGRLAGAIFADDAVNAAFTNLKVDLLVGVHFAEALIDTS